MRLVRAVLVALLAIVLSPAAFAAPCAGFTDVDATSPFCVNVAWMRNRGITLGLTPTLYDPNSPVTRLQMAAFMYRLGVQNAFLQGGNAFATTAVLGTTDNRPLQFNVNGFHALTLRPVSTLGGSLLTPNLVGGHDENRVQITCAGICVPTPEPASGAVIAGGGAHNFTNRVTDSYGVVGGGWDNQAGNNDASHLNAWASTVGGGRSNEASGSYSTVPGGTENVAQGWYSFAAGRRAKAFNHGCFVWGDSTDGDIACGFQNQFVARATGGVFFYSQVGPAAGVQLQPGASSWSMLSDRASKENVVPVDAEAMLARLTAMPISTWNYVAQSPKIRHVGPMAQDFHVAFGVGEDERLISTIDAQGVALAAIQGLNAKVEARLAERDAKIARLESELAAIRSLLTTVVARSPQTAGIAP